MGQLNTPRQPDPNTTATTIQHFSHPHPLYLTTQQTLILTACSACNLPTSGLTYTCQPCNYSLHTKCTQLPPQINHPFHPQHTFSLLPTPIYPEGIFSCDACGKQGTGFSYHCKACGLDLHVGCASLPLSLSHHSHHHQLSLNFSPPYYDKSFSCDVCNNIGLDHWLYRCDPCGFDAHLSCVNGEPLGQLAQAPNVVQRFQMPQQYHTPLTDQVQAPIFYMQNFQTMSRGAPQFQAMGTPYQATGAPYGSGPYCHNYPPNNLMNRGGNGLTSDVMNQAIQGLTSGFSQAAGQQLFQGLMGGGSGGSGDGDGGGGGNFLQGLVGGGDTGGGGFLGGSTFTGGQ